MHKLFTEGLKGEPQKETDIGLMPKNWEVRAIRDLILDTETRNPEKEPAKQIKYIDVSSVSNKAFCVIGCQDFIGKDAPGRARKIVNTNDVIISSIEGSGISGFASDSASLKIERFLSAGWL